MQVTKEQLLKIMPKCPADKVEAYTTALNAALAEYGITTKNSIAAFIAQMAEETGQLTELSENLYYSAKRLLELWPKRFDATTAKQYEKKPESIANHVYALRYGNGDEKSGDGWKYRGRGACQTTFKDNYSALGKNLNLDLVAHPELVATPEVAFRAFGFFWKVNDLSTLADAGKFDEITKKINGGTNGAAERRAFFNLALQVL